MDAVVQSAWISAAATVVGVGGTATVAIVGLRFSRSASDKAVASARETNLATIEAARADVQATLQTTRDGQIADLYGKAIEQLGADKLDVRIGGIYALERIARDSARDHPTVMEVLTAFIREHSREPWSPLSSDGDLSATSGDEADLDEDIEPGWRDANSPVPVQPSIRPDVDAALMVVARRDHDRDIRSIDLGGANLAGAILNGASLSGAKLTRTDLTGADLRNADLNGAKLAGAILNGASLDRANLSRAVVEGASLIGTIIGHANLTDSSFDFACLNAAMLMGADLRTVRLYEADLAYAQLYHARWPPDRPVPDGWRLDDSGRLIEAGTDLGPTEQIN